MSVDEGGVDGAGGTENTSHPEGDGLGEFDEFEFEEEFGVFPPEDGGPRRRSPRT
ncbi:hypothetical protein ACFQ9X_01305 [Catenulispora yoronensis]